MWTGLWSLGAMWRKMIQFWEIMEHQNPDNEHLDDQTSMVTRQKSTSRAPHKILKKMFNRNITEEKLRIFSIFNIQGSSMLPYGWLAKSLSWEQGTPVQGQIFGGRKKP